MLRSPKARTWSQRGYTPRVTIRVAGSGRISSPAWCAAEPATAPGSSSGCWSTTAARASGKASARRASPSCWTWSTSSSVGPAVLVWDNYTHHVDAEMRELIAVRDWLSVFRLPSYTPDFNPAEGVWAHLKHSLGHLAPRSIDDLLQKPAPVRNGCGTNPACSTDSSPRRD
ncbi:transposase [Streptomyces rimosus]|uniref:transposase n=1 Tax=Streptomyces rimosus TaxID=1927 RepID=UPI00373FCB08